MIGILLLSHGNLGDSLIQAARHVMGKELPHLTHLDVTVVDTPDALLARANALLDQLNQGQGVLVLSDICGATPCNVATRLVVTGKVECLAGANLPMLLRALTYRHEPLAVVVEKALSGGKEGAVRIQRIED